MVTHRIHESFTMHTCRYIIIILLSAKPFMLYIQIFLSIGFHSLSIYTVVLHLLKNGIFRSIIITLCNTCTKSLIGYIACLSEAIVDGVPQ